MSYVTYNEASEATHSAEETGERSRKRRREESDEVGDVSGRKIRRIRHEDLLVPRFLGDIIENRDIVAFAESASKFPMHPILQNIIREDGLERLADDRLLVPDSVTFEKVEHKFNTMVKFVPSAPNQKSSGRCWMFAALNTVRTAMMNKYILEGDFEFSESHLFFWDKLERANIFLERVIKYAGEGFDSDWNGSIFHRPVSDGGEWQYFQNLVEKYGLVPKKDMPETADTSSSSQICELLSSHLRAYGLELRGMANDASVSPEAIIERKKELLNIIYEILVKTFREPPKTITWEFKLRELRHPKTKTVPDLTPREFFRRYVPYGLEGRVSLCNNPSEGYEYDKLYAHETGLKLAGGALQSYLNLKYDDIVSIVIKSIEAGDSVYFTCNVGDKLDKKRETLDLRNHDFSLLFPRIPEMTKKERMDTGEAHSTHAMTLVGVELKDKKPVRWCVLNSWGSRKGQDGKITMTHDWFLQNTFKFTVAKKYLPDEVKELFKQEPEIVPIEGMSRSFDEDF
ncbi:MAG: bleomycin hydrolase [Chlamydiales bacterium]